MTSAATSTPLPNSAPVPVRRGLPHLPVLDGVRGLAILLILFHHFFWIDDVALPAWVKPVQNSLFIGVDLFFVLSGFLITRILLQARGERHYFRNFYIRRTLRIFPLYYAFLLGMLLLWLIGGRMLHWSLIDPSGQVPESLSVFPWAALFLGNVLIVKQAGPLFVALNPIWSLSVEEHFYLVWPSLTRFIPPRIMLRLCAGVILGTLALRWAAFAFWQPLFHRPLPESTLSYFTLFRADALAAGAALAILLYLEVNQKLIARTALAGMILGGGALSVLAIARGGLDYQKHLGDTVWMYSALALFFWGMLALVVLHQNSAAARALGHPIMRFFGKFSYALYLFNLPVWIYLGRAFSADKLAHWRGWQVILLREVLAWPITIALALLSWHLLEKRCLKLKARFEPKGVESGVTETRP